MLGGTLEHFTGWETLGLSIRRIQSCSHTETGDYSRGRRSTADNSHCTRRGLRLRLAAVVARWQEFAVYPYRQWSLQRMGAASQRRQASAVDNLRFWRNLRLPLVPRW